MKLKIVEVAIIMSFLLIFVAPLYNYFYNPSSISIGYLVSCFISELSAFIFFVLLLIYIITKTIKSELKFLNITGAFICIILSEFFVTYIISNLQNNVISPYMGINNVTLYIVEFVFSNILSGCFYMLIGYFLLFIKTKHKNKAAVVFGIARTAVFILFHYIWPYIGHIFYYSF